MLLLYANAIGAVALLAFASAGAGCWIARMLPKHATLLDEASLTLAGGSGVLGTALFLFGQIWFSRGVILTVLLIAAGLGIGPLLRYLREFAAYCGSGRFPKIPAAVIALVLAVTAVAGLAGISGGWGSDAVSYHLYGPKEWLRLGAIRPVPDNCLTAFPQTGEVLFAALMATGRDRAPGFSAVFTLAILLLVLASLGARCKLGESGAWWCVALAASMPALYAGAHTAFIDVFYATMVLAAVRIALDAETLAHFAALGIFCGLAMGAKYTGLLAFPAVLASAIVARWESLEVAPAAANARKFALTASVACGVCAPFYLRNWILLGSPIYPPPLAMLRFFHAKYLTPEMLRQMQAFLWQRGAGLGRGPLAYLLLPFHLTYRTADFHGAGGIGLAPLAFAPFAAVRAIRQREMKALLVFAGCITTFWFLQQESRYLIPSYAVLAVIAVSGWGCASLAAGRWASRLASAAVAISVAYGCLMILRSRQADLHAVASFAYAEQHRREVTPYVESFDFLNHDASVRKVLILDRSVMPYNLDRDYVKPIGMWGEQTLPNVRNSAEALGQLRALGVSHVIDVLSEVAPFQVPSGYPGLKLVLSLANQRVYRVAGGASPAPSS